MKGCMACGKLDAEKNTPENTHIGSIIRFMSPDAPSTVRTREAPSRPIAPKVSDAIRQMKASAAHEPRAGTPKTSTPKPKSVTTSKQRSVKRDSRNDARYSARRIGVAIK